MEEAQTASAGDLQQLQQAQAGAALAEQRLGEASGRADALQQQLTEALARTAQAGQDLQALQQQAGSPPDAATGARHRAWEIVLGW